jgi:hypothetical protein
MNIFLQSSERLLCPKLSVPILQLIPAASIKLNLVLISIAFHSLTNNQTGQPNCSIDFFFK